MFLVLSASGNREAIGERTKAALQVKKERSQRVGEIPFGFKLAADKVSLIPDKVEQKILKIIRELRAAGLSYRKIGEELEKRNIRTKKGAAKWQPKTIQNLCQAC